MDNVDNYISEISKLHVWQTDKFKAFWNHFLIICTICRIQMHQAY